MSQIEFAQDSVDWTHVVRTRKDVRRCKRGKHLRIMKASDCGRPVCRCSCGAIEFDYDGLWCPERNPVGIRTEAEVAERIANDVNFEETMAKLLEWARKRAE